MHARTRIVVDQLALAHRVAHHGVLWVAQLLSVHFVLLLGRLVRIVLVLVRMIARRPLMTILRLKR